MGTPRRERVGLRLTLVCVSAVSLIALCWMLAVGLDRAAALAGVWSLAVASLTLVLELRERIRAANEPPQSIGQLAND
jgi:hypothetical protein